MHSKTLISILVWVAAHCLSSVVSELEPSELVRQLNMLVRHPGWRDGMQDVKILIHNGRDISDPMSAILEAISANRDPIDESNVSARYKEIWHVLMCKYADIIHMYKILIQHFIRVCRYEKKRCDFSFQRYTDCVRLLLVKIHSVSPRFKFMNDALEFFFALGPQKRPNHGLLIATEQLTKYTLTVGPETSARLSAHGFKVDLVDDEIKSIYDFFLDVNDQVIRIYSRKHCIIPKRAEWTVEKFNEDFIEKKNKQLIPQESTMLDYIVNELDCYVSEIFDIAFYKLDFAYDVDGKVTIGIS